MKTILVTGGTVFVSRAVAEYFVAKGERVYVLNRNTRAQPAGAALLAGDRHQLGDLLRGLSFDAVLDMTAYTAGDVNDLLDALGAYGVYVLMSSSAVYPETTPQPFREDAPLGPNRFWGRYGTDKIAAEQAMRARDPRACIVRPPYLYGAMNNVYREAFVFDCALADRPFYLPGDGSLPLQFFHVGDLCRFLDALLTHPPETRVFNLGNPECLSAREWVALCYEAAERTPRFVCVDPRVEQRDYFPFYRYAYSLDVRRQASLLPEVLPMQSGLREAFLWHVAHPDEVRRKPYFSFLDRELAD